MHLLNSKDILKYLKVPDLHDNPFHDRDLCLQVFSKQQLKAGPFKGEISPQCSLSSKSSKASPLGIKGKRLTITSQRPLLQPQATPPCTPWWESLCLRFLLPTTSFSQRSPHMACSLTSFKSTLRSHLYSSSPYRTYFSLAYYWSSSNIYRKCFKRITTGMWSNPMFQCVPISVIISCS